LGRFTAFLDASVLYPAPLGDLLLELAVSELYRAKWSNTVHDEWINTLLRSRDDLTRERLERARAGVSDLNYPVLPDVLDPGGNDMDVVCQAA
jgi:hypothetical protein